MSNSRKIKQIERAMQGALSDLFNQQNTRKILNEARDIIQRRTRLGFGVPRDGAERERLKALSESYVKQRAGQLGFFTDRQGRVRPIKNPKVTKPLNPRTTPRKSNLTFTNQLLDSLESFNTGPGKGEIKPVGLRDDGLTNEKVAEFVSKDRPFLHLSRLEIRQIEFFVRELLTSLVKKRLTGLK